MSEKPDSCYLEYGFCNYNLAFDIFPLGAAPSASFRVTPQSPEELSPEDLVKMSRDLMLEIADSCIKRGAKYIGHIKSYLKSDEGEIFADTLGIKRTTNVKSTVIKPLKSARLVVNSIVQGIDKSQLVKATVESIYKVVKDYGFYIDMGIPEVSFGIPEIPEGCYLEYGVSGYGVVVNIFRLTPQSPEDLVKMSRDLMLEIADSCIKRGAKYIGHIKSYLKSDEGEIFADTLGIKRTTNVKSTVIKPLKSARLVVNSIVQGIDKSQVKATTVESIYKVIKNYGFSLKVEEERLYYDDFG